MVEEGQLPLPSKFLAVGKLLKKFVLFKCFCLEMQNL